MAPLLVGVVAVVLLTAVWRQIGHPFLAHDDWDSILPVDGPWLELHHNRLRAEGRWLNYVWWYGPGHLMDQVSATLLYEISLLVTAARLATRWTPGWWTVPTMLALFASPMMADLQFWPATLGLSMLLIAVAACSVTWAVARPRRLAVWLFTLTVLAFLGYPPAALAIFVIVMVELIADTPRRLLTVTITFGLGYAAGTAGALLLNGIAFGTFHLDLRPWRHPNPIHDLGDLGENLSRAWSQVGDLVGVITIPALLGTLAACCCLALPATRQRAARLLLVLVVALGVQLSATVLTGVTTPFRSNLWIWILLVVPFVWLAVEPTARIWFRVGAGIGLVALGSWGARYWQHAVDEQQHSLRVGNRIENRLVALHRAHPDYRVLVYGSPADWLNPVFTQEAQYLSLKTFEEHGIQVADCRPPGCPVSLRPSVVARAHAGSKVVTTGRFLLIVPSSREHP